MITYTIRINNIKRYLRREKELCLLPIFQQQEDALNWRLKLRI